jgi:hypothetical protein
MPNNAADEARIEQFKSVMGIASLALRTAILINGGAIIALLAFIGGLEESKLWGIPTLIYSIKILSVGIAAASISILFAYFSQACHLKAIKDTGYDSKNGERLGVFSAIFVILSYTLFAIGSVWATTAYIPSS